MENSFILQNEVGGEVGGGTNNHNPESRSTRQKFRGGRETPGVMVGRAVLQ